jgi:hypothetical protein
MFGHQCLEARNAAYFLVILGGGDALTAGNTAHLEGAVEDRFAGSWGRGAN